MWLQWFHGNQYILIVTEKEKPNQIMDWDRYIENCKPYVTRPAKMDQTGLNYT